MAWIKDVVVFVCFTTMIILGAMVLFHMVLKRGHSLMKSLPILTTVSTGLFMTLVQGVDCFIKWKTRFIEEVLATNVLESVGQAFVALILSSYVTLIIYKKWSENEWTERMCTTSLVLLWTSLGIIAISHMKRQTEYARMMQSDNMIKMIIVTWHECDTKDSVFFFLAEYIIFYVPIIVFLVASGTLFENFNDIANCRSRSSNACEICDVTNYHMGKSLIYLSLFALLRPTWAGYSWYTYNCFSDIPSNFGILPIYSAICFTHIAAVKGSKTEAVPELENIGSDFHLTPDLTAKTLTTHDLKILK